MADEIPQWALDKATAIRNAGYADGLHSITETFARYIAAHEEAPVDPLLIEARNICADTVEKSASTWKHGKAGEYRDGRLDGDDGLIAVLAALRRGIELSPTHQSGQPS